MCVMSYNPDEHTVTFRQVLAGWGLCLAIIGLAVAATGRQPPAPAARADDPSYIAAASAHRPIHGVHIPHFAQCAAVHADKVRAVGGPMSMPTNLCS
jgi:hypothetical protein